MGFCWKKGWRHRSVSRRRRFAAIEEKIWLLAIIRLFLEAQYRRRRIRTQQHQTHPLRPALAHHARAARDGNYRNTPGSVSVSAPGHQEEIWNMRKILVD